MSQTPQTYANHAKLVPAFHVFVLPVLLINAIWTIVRFTRHPSAEGGLAIAVAIALLLLAVLARRFALTVQDRVIRLEMQLRLQKVLPTDLASRIEELDHGQLVALRFASDAELPALARTVLTDKIRDRKTIKKMIKEWRADHLRA